MSSDLQFYATPAWVTQRLLSRLRRGAGNLWMVYDPCAGEGAILTVARELGWETAGTELDPDRSAHCRDVLSIDVRTGDGLTMPESVGAVMVCNPPFRGESWWPWLDLANQFSQAWLLLPTTVFNAEKHQRKLAEAGARPFLLPGRTSFTGSSPKWGCVWWHCGIGDCPFTDWSELL